MTKKATRYRPKSKFARGYTTQHGGPVPDADAPPVHRLRDPKPGEICPVTGEKWLPCLGVGCEHGRWSKHPGDRICTRGKGRQDAVSRSLSPTLVKPSPSPRAV